MPYTCLGVEGGLSGCSLLFNVWLTRYVSELRLVRVLSTEGGIYKFSAKNEDASAEHYFHVFVNSKSLGCSGAESVCRKKKKRSCVTEDETWPLLSQVSQLSSLRKGPLMDRCAASLQGIRFPKSAGTSVRCPTHGKKPSMHQLLSY